MKYINILFFISIVTLVSCNNDETQDEPTFGSFSIGFDNFAGTEDVELTTDGSTEYPFSNELGQDFNISLLGYYISEIKLEGPNGELWEDEMLATAEESNGYYHVLEHMEHTQMLDFEGVPAGMYNKLTFTLGVQSEGITEGAAGGVLDVANGGWFWNWNNGYIAFALEGQSPASPGEAGANSLAEDNPHSMAFHIGGWNEPNNNREITIELGQHVEVNEENVPFAHIGVDILTLFKGANTIDFSQMHSVHAPADGALLAENIKGAFYLHHLEHDMSSHDHSH